jgi:hypothetical protein
MNGKLYKITETGSVLMNAYLISIVNEILWQVQAMRKLVNKNNNYDMHEYCISFVHQYFVETFYGNVSSLIYLFTFGRKKNADN